MPLNPVQTPQANGAQVQSVRRVIVQPADGSDFMVALPFAMPSDVYEVAPSMVNGVAAVIIQCPDSLAGDRTTTQFRVLTSAALANGDSIAFLVLA
jgi:hypothetical protein